MKKIYLITLAIVCAASMSAAKLYLGGIELGNKEKNIYGAGELSSVPEGIVVWEPGKSTLTLTEAIVNWDGYTGHVPEDTEAEDGLAAIYYYGDDVLIVQIEGECTFNESSGKWKRLNAAIYAAAGSKIIKEGTKEAKLTVNAPTGIVCFSSTSKKGSITLEQVNLVINASRVGFNTYPQGQENSITIKDGTRLEINNPNDRECIPGYNFMLTLGENEKIFVPEGATIVTRVDEGVNYINVLWYNNDFVKGKVIINDKNAVESGIEAVRTNDVRATKTFRNGQLLIQRGDEIFNATGTKVQ